MNYHVCCFLFLQEGTEKKKTFFLCMAVVINIQELDWLAEMQQDVAAEVSLRSLVDEFSRLFDKPRLMGVASHLPSPKLT